MAAFNLNPIYLCGAKSYELNLNGIGSWFNILDFKFTGKVRETLVVGSYNVNRSVRKRLSRSFINDYTFQYPLALCKGHGTKGQENEYEYAPKIHSLEYA